MTTKHSNPQTPKRVARAPYNFISLPDKVLEVQTPLPLDIYQGESGYIVVNIKTSSPTYTRGMLTPDQFKRFGNKKSDQLTDEEKTEKADFYSLSPDDLLDGHPKPNLPGSSLRGLVRTIVEIASHGKMRWVSDSPSISFRSVAAGASDPLTKPYKEILSTLSAGYLKKTDNGWAIIPAKTPKEMKFEERAPYLKVKKYVSGLSTLPGFKDFVDKDYVPVCIPVSFDAEEKTEARGIYTAVTKIEEQSGSLAYRGVLVCSGNMLETDSGTTASPRKNFALVLEKNLDKKPIEIPAYVLEDYKNTLTGFQSSKPFDPVNGMLKNNAPVFFATQNNEIVAFGHTPNFRIPARQPGIKKASTPFDFVPANLRDENMLDMADVLFGWVQEGNRKTSMAGRVFFEDAVFESANDKGEVWYTKDYIVPAILASPKPTTFQHYLSQDKATQHDPDNKPSLAHYATSSAQTQIRGNKWYWHKGQSPKIEIDKHGTDLEKVKTQTTRIRPIKEGVTFKAKIRFENLRKEELGALLWALALPGKNGEEYRHKFGMGKPLGMGAVEIKIENLVITNYDIRYTSLLSDKNDAWFTAERDVPREEYIKDFESCVLKGQEASLQKGTMADLPRITDLFTMLKWENNPSKEWLDWTRYMEIEHKSLDNEYKERPVLPNPFGVWSKVNK